ncbi:MAG: septation ring formation regulator EzrA [Pelagibacterales bacterium MED-G40]|nr:MAG: septation ring formation regulator EzrA [Pelagibacterales bacterium MED-G40]|tara:strand:- start:221 stop:517 length:297 start_codon:yes stop_codon:yes gene_type:complete
MELIKLLKTKKLILLNIFLTLYVGTNLIGGERGLISYFEKKNLEKKLSNKKFELSNKLNELENENKLLSEKIDLDYLDTLYRQKLKFGKRDEILIKLE